MKVPKENLLGEIGGGWQVAMTTLLHERGTLGFALGGALELQVTKLVALAKERAADDPLIRDRVAQEWIELQALKLTNNRSLTTLMQTGIPGPEGSGSKLHWSEQNQRLTKLAMEILEGEDDGYWRLPAAALARQHDRGRHERDPAQHHRRARARPAKGSLVQFAFTEEQETLRREARDVLANGGWGKDEVAELGFLDRAVLYEEAGARTAARSSSRRRAPEDEQLAALSLEAVGIGAKALELAVEYAKSREQFGKPIGTYQAVSHQLANTYVEMELARSLAYWAAWCVAEGDEQAEVACAAAKAYCGDAAVAACERSIQVHGGIGFTWEHVLHVYYKRAQWIQAHGGYASKHRARIAAHLLD